MSAVIGPYSQAVKAGNFFCAGQIPVNPSDDTVSYAIDEQTKQTFESLKNILDAAGTRL